MTKLTCTIFIYSDKSNFFHQFFYKLFFMYRKMSNNSSAKFYRDNKGRLQEKSPCKI